MAAMITIACGRPSSSRRTQQRSTSLSAYMPKGFSTQSGVSQRRTTVAKKVQPKGFRSNYKVPVAEQMKPIGRWTSKLQVKDAAMVAHTTRFQPRVQVRVQVKPQVKRNSRPCAYCKEEGCHIRTCDKLAAKNARKNASKKAAKKAWKDAAAERLAAKIRKAEEEKARQEELARQQEAEIVTAAMVISSAVAKKRKRKLRTSQLCLLLLRLPRRSASRMIARIL